VLYKRTLSTYRTAAEKHPLAKRLMQENVFLSIDKFDGSFCVSGDTESIKRNIGIIRNNEKALRNFLLNW